MAKSWGVEHMYVHVEAENVGAKRFCMRRKPFIVAESEETEAFALSLSRPRSGFVAQPVNARAEDFSGRYP